MPIEFGNEKRTTLGASPVVFPKMAYSVSLRIARNCFIAGDSTLFFL